MSPPPESPRPGSIADQRRLERESRVEKSMRENLAYCRAVLRGENPDPPGDPTLFGENTDA